MKIYLLVKTILVKYYIQFFSKVDQSFKFSTNFNEHSNKTNIQTVKNTKMLTFN